MIIGLLHPGNMGAAIGARLKSSGHTVLWHPAHRSQATRDRATRAGLTTCDSLTELLNQAATVLSVCPSAAALSIAEEVARCEYAGVYIDANAISPKQMVHIADLVGSAGADVADATISGPPPDAESSPKFFLAGPDHAVGVAAELLEEARFAVDALSETIGAASALKMALISYQRPARLLAAIAHGLAGSYGVTEAFTAEADRVGTDILGERGALPSVAARAWRWIPELHEVAQSLDINGLPDEFATAAARLYELFIDDKDNWELAPEDVIKRLENSQSRR
ncbi:NAD(P)-binding domain-containing protein [Nocardia sp. NPDC050435]|uniref:NAD(P)-dependent oxidoreductase n=1 Tax=Nocardia sp. NPDC050435 TaxID=3155040 RepID=UPI0033BFDDD3